MVRYTTVEYRNNALIFPLYHITPAQIQKVRISQKQKPMYKIIVYYSILFQYYYKVFFCQCQDIYTLFYVVLKKLRYGNFYVYKDGFGMIQYIDKSILSDKVPDLSVNLNKGWRSYGCPCRRYYRNEKAAPMRQ